MHPDEVPWPSLATWAATTPISASPAWGHPSPDALGWLDRAGIRGQLDDLLDTVVVLQRAEWLQDGVYVGPRTTPDAWTDVIAACRALSHPVPPAILGAGRGPGVLGTDRRAFLHLPALFLASAKPAERRFAVGRLVGHVAAKQVSAVTLYALLADQGGLRRLATRALGPTLEIVLAPLSLGARVALSSAQRTHELVADRAGLLCADPDPAAAIDAAGRAMLRLALGTVPEGSPADYLDALEHAHSSGSPGRFAELWSAQPWLHKRLLALEAFVASDAWVAHGRTRRGAPLDDDALAARTTELLRVRS